MNVCERERGIVGMQERMREKDKTAENMHTLIAPVRRKGRRGEEGGRKGGRAGGRVHLAVDWLR